MHEQRQRKGRSKSPIKLEHFCKNAIVSDARVDFVKQVNKRAVDDFKQAKNTFQLKGLTFIHNLSRLALPHMQ